MSVESLDSRRSITVFAVPKPFRGHIGMIQRNALESWRRLNITHEIILLGQEDGVSEAATAVGIKHHQQVCLDSFGTPLVNDVIRLAETTAATKWLCYVNADIILMPEFGDAVSLAIGRFEHCLVVSQRWNLDIREPIQFHTGWEERLRAFAASNSKLFTTYGIDVFVFPKGFFTHIPSFSLGRPYWDNWMISHARQRGCPVVDVTVPSSVIHQDHAYDGFRSADEIRRAQQGLRNFWLAGDSVFGLSHTGNATHFVSDGEIKESERQTVSVVIPHAGTYPQLRKCLRALSDQTYPRTYIEIIIVENSDQSVNAHAVLEFPFVKVTRETKSGPAAARNKGAAIAQGQLICFLDSDCNPAGDWIEQCVNAAAKNNLRSIVASNILPWDPGHGAAGVKWYEALVYHDQKGYVEVCKACITGGMTVPREVWIKVGPFDEQFPEAACEDWEWSTRASSQQVPIVFCAEAVIQHPLHCTWRELRIKAQRTARGELILARKRRRFNILNIDYQFADYSKRLRRELALIIYHKQIPWHHKLSVVSAACLVWFWSIIEIRKQLASPPASMSKRRIFRRTRKWKSVDSSQKGV
jgi:GT2 family glycosyltransferase